MCATAAMSRSTRDELNESYMMHGSTSPQYNMIASLDVATKMMADNGQIMMEDVIIEAVSLRQKVSRIAAEMKAAGDWFFEMWQPKIVEYIGKQTPFEDVPAKYLCDNQHPWVFSQKDNWHGFDDIEDKLRHARSHQADFTTPGLSEDGVMADEGIPAASSPTI